MEYLFFAILSFLAVVLLMPKYIVFLKKIGFNQKVSEYALNDFKEKDKTPIMGGVIFILIPILIILIFKFNLLFNPKILVILVTYFLFGLIGFLDDYLIIRHNDNTGLNAKKKLFLQIIASVIIFLLLKDNLSFIIKLPFLNHDINLGYLYPVFLLIMFTGETNAVNFTDGMDGLCAGCVSISLFFFGIIAYLKNEFEILLIIILVISALIGYLKFNFFPAKIFMGDSGSIALGALLVIISVVLKVEILLLFIGATYLWEMLSVIIQIFWVKTFKKRIFLYTPIHYSFSKKGMKEKNVVLMFYKITFITSLIGFLIGMYL